MPMGIHTPIPSGIPMVQCKIMEAHFSERRQALLLNYMENPIFGFLMFWGFFDFFIAVLGPRMVSIGFPEPVGSILAEYEPEPTHLDPIHCPNRRFWFLFLPQIPTSAKFCVSPFSPTMAFLIFLTYSTRCAIQS